MTGKLKVIPEKQQEMSVRKTKEKKTRINITSKVKFEVYGEEMLEKEVKQSGNSGRVYMPPEWIGKHVKIIRVD